MPGKFFTNPEEGPPSPVARARAYSDGAYATSSTKNDQKEQEQPRERKTFSMFARSALVHGSTLSEKRYKEIKQAFAVYDQNGDGHISYKELGIVMKSMGMNVSGPELEAMYEQVDTDKDGKISFEEFKVMMERQDKIQSLNTEVCCLFAPYYLIQCMKVEGVCCCNKPYETPVNGPTVCKLVDVINYCCLLNIFFPGSDEKHSGKGSGKYQR